MDSLKRIQDRLFAEGRFIDLVGCHAYDPHHHHNATQEFPDKEQNQEIKVDIEKSCQLSKYSESINSLQLEYARRQVALLRRETNNLLGEVSFITERNHHHIEYAKGNIDHTEIDYQVNAEENIDHTNIDYQVNVEENIDHTEIDYQVNVEENIEHTKIDYQVNV